MLVETAEKKLGRKAQQLNEESASAGRKAHCSVQQCRCCGKWATEESCGGVGAKMALQGEVAGCCVGWVGIRRCKERKSRGGKKKGGKCMQVGSGSKSLG